ncbi:transcriptional regulator [Sphaerisporangium rufum]|uniref:Transcriptional regulator n=1 Tax=Sphaerisporangium rufum TaxID=1381558 RepID=A0A919V0L7_9ACTN|nr:helix-turn-helix transcriptional regulator [Sphaerisporangium rufum]GII77577.1 transcriptional regulator [Sphaerisporangium rufum]
MFAFELRRFRAAAGLTQDALGARMKFSGSQVAMVETMRRSPSEEFARECDNALGLDGVMLGFYTRTLWKEAPEHIRPFLEEEQDASGLRTWEPVIVPGLFQTEAYAREILGSSPGVTAEKLEERLANRMHRQAILRRADAPDLIVIMDEVVIQRVIGSATLTCAQLTYLLEVSRHPMVTIQIVPFASSAHCGMVGGFIVAERNGVPQAAYVEGQPHGRTLYDRARLVRLMQRYDAIRAEALPSRQSLRLIEEAVKTYA